jgi:hypothetical protein
MRYAAVLEGPVASLAKCAQCFTSDLCRITELNSLWVLKSSSFNSCSSSSDVFPLADRMISTVRRILSLYCGLSYPLTVTSIQCIHPAGHICGNTIRAAQSTVITSPKAMTELAGRIHERPLATAIFESTLTDDTIKEALTLYQDTENRWADVYNIIEFLGGPDQIGQSGLGARTVASVVKRTANHYRHLGHPKSFLLPSNPPTLGEASLFAKRALSRWIESRLLVAPSIGAAAITRQSARR